MQVTSRFFKILKNRIDLHQIPFSERGSRILLFQNNEHFSVQLAERWLKMTGKLSAYRNRPPLIDDWVFTNQYGEPLPTRITTYPHCVEVATSLGNFLITFQDSETIYISLPAAPCGLRFRAHMDQAQCDRRGGILRLTGNIRRNIAYTTNARILVNTAQADSPTTHVINLRLDASQGNRGLLINITPRLGFNRWLSDPHSILETAAKRWEEWFVATPEVLPIHEEQYYYAWWIMRVGLLSTRYYTTREVMTPSKSYYVGSWQWDNYFHALAYRHVAPRLAQDQLRILLDHQREDGMIPDAIHDEGTVTHLDFPVEADVTKPPLIAWTAWKLFEHDGDSEFLNEIYEPLVKWNNWWFQKNDLNGNGLCEYQHPFSSGLDDSPLWDEGMPVESPDLNTYLYLQQEALARIAKVIGEDQDADMWTQRARTMLQRMLTIQWDEGAGVFWASLNGRRINCLTPMNLLPLITGQLPPAVTQKLIQHLTDPKEFWPPYPIPTVALNDPKFDPQQMWRGPTWANINYLMTEGLFRCGYANLGRELRRRTLNLLSGQKDFYEYYNPLNGVNPPKAAHIFGWSAALFIEMVIQETREKITREGQPAPTYVGKG